MGKAPFGLLGGAGQRTVRTLAQFVMVGVILYVLMDIVLALLPPHYSLLANAESDYGIGPFATLMDANFILRGLLSMALVLALGKAVKDDAKSSLGLWAFSLWAVFSALLAFFPTSLEGQLPTYAGRVHAFFSQLALLAAAGGQLYISRKIVANEGFQDLSSRFSVLSMVSVGALILTGVAIRGAGRHGALGNLDGLFERIYLASILGWTWVMARRLVANSRESSDKSSFVG